MEDSQIWTEKYRPKRFEEVKGQKKIVKRVKAFVEKKNLPHLLLAGPSGVGKTTLSFIVAKQLFGESWRNNFLDLNASDSRGIETVRGEIKDFARTKAIGNVPFKIIFLDESDSLTKEAQQALRRTMENFSGSCRFILNANFSSRIIDAIQSRCTVFRFKPLKEEEVYEMIDNISKKEKIEVDENARKALYDVSEGDLRRVVNIVQSCAVLSKSINEDLIYEVVSAAKPKEVKEVLKLAIKGDFVKARDLLIETMLKHGLSGLDIIKQIQKEIIDVDVDDDKRIEMIERCGEIEFRMVEGSDEFVQLEALIASFCKK